MKHRDLILFGALAAVAVASAPVASQAPQAEARATTGAETTFTPPRTPWGDPDLQGIWRGRKEVAFQRDRKFGTREFLTDDELAAKNREWDELAAATRAGKVESRGFRNFPLARRDDPGPRPQFDRRTSAIVDPPDGRLPALTPQAVQRYEAKEAAQVGRGESDSWMDRWSHERCISAFWAPTVHNWGMGYGKRGLGAFDESDLGENAKAKEGLTIVAAGVAGSNKASAGPVRRFLQAPGYVAITYEEGNASGLEQETYRMIPLDGRPVPETRSWMGTSRGHWEGDTLVVVTTKVFYDEPILPTYGHHGQYPGTGETLTVTQRFRLLDANTLEFRTTIEDPATYIRPYTVVQTLSRNDDFRIDPAMCQENNFRNLSGQLAQGRVDEKLSMEYSADSARLRGERMEELKAEWAEAWATLKGNPSR